MHNTPEFEPSYALLGLLEYLKKEYYGPVEKICEKLAYRIGGTPGNEVPPSESPYIVRCKDLVEQVGKYARLRRLSLLPYLSELVEKEDIGHDCRACSSSCTIRHTTQLQDIHDAHLQIRESIDMLRSISVPLPQDLSGRDFDMHLRDETSRLEEMIFELFCLEETALMPKISELQKAIHAHD